MDTAWNRGGSADLVNRQQLVDPQSAGIVSVKVPPVEPPAQPVCSDCGQQPAKPKLGPQPGWFTISVNHIQGRTEEYRYFLEFEPVDWIGYSMPVYHITLDEANRVRRKLGLPELPGAEGGGQRPESEMRPMQAGNAE